MAVEVDEEGVAGDLHGVDVELVELHVVTGRFSGFGEEQFEEVSHVDFHLLRELFAEEGNEEEVEFLGGGEVVDAGVAEADGFAFGLREDGDVGVRGEADSDAGAEHAGAELGFGFDVDDDAVFFEGDFGVLRVDVAGLSVGTLDEVFAVGAVEELLLERALERLGRDAEFDGMRGERRDAEEEGDGDKGWPEAHAFEDNVWGCGAGLDEDVGGAVYKRWKL